MDAANGAATATISNGGTPVAPTDRTAVDTLVGRNITDHTAPDATALRECHFGEQQHPRQRCEQAGEKSALVGHGAIIAARRGEKEGPDGRSGNAGKPTTSLPGRRDSGNSAISTFCHRDIFAIPATAIFKSSHLPSNPHYPSEPLR